MDDTLAMLDDALQRVLDDTVEPRRTIAAESAGIDRDAWARLRELGVVGAAAAELTLAQLARVAERVAFAGALVPYADSEAIGRWLAAGLDLAADDDVLTVVPVDVAATAASAAGEGIVLRLPGVPVPWAGVATRVLFSLQAGDQAMVAAVAPAALPLRAAGSLAGEPHALIGDVPVNLPATALRSVGESRGPHAVRRRGALFRAVQMLGAMTRVNALTLQYARDRKQFRRPLADFQVIQSHLAAMAGELCAAGASVDAAIDAAEGGDAFEAIAAAKIRTGQAVRQIASLGHQVHGAIGFTQEYPLNVWTRRLWTWRDEFGSEAQWAQALGDRIAARGADAFWPDLTALAGAADE